VTGTHYFSGIPTVAAGYSHSSSPASMYLAGNRGTLVGIPNFYRDLFEPSINDSPRDRDPYTEYGIDIIIDTVAAAPIWPVQILELTGRGRVLDSGVVTSDGEVVGGKWQVAYKGLKSDFVLTAKSDAKDL